MKKNLILPVAFLALLAACKKETSTLSKSPVNNQAKDSSVVNNGLQTLTYNDGAFGIPAKLPDGSYRFAKDGVNIILRNVITENTYYYGDVVDSYDMEVENQLAPIRVSSGYFVANYSQLGSATYASIITNVNNYNQAMKDYAEGTIDPATNQLKQPVLPQFANYINSGSGSTGTVKGIIIRNPNSPSTLSYANENFQLNINTAFGAYLGVGTVNGVSYTFYGRNGAIRRILKYVNGAYTPMRFESGTYAPTGTYSSNVRASIYNESNWVSANLEVFSVVD